MTVELTVGGDSRVGQSRVQSFRVAVELNRRADSRGDSRAYSRAECRANRRAESRADSRFG